MQIYTRLKLKLPTTLNDISLNFPIYTESLPSGASWELLFSRDISSCDSFLPQSSNRYTFPL